ncbi:MAG: two-component regulator propeller domain-containing protein, partial [Candidatus Latescibacterota bacterium]
MILHLFLRFLLLLTFCISFSTGIASPKVTITNFACMNDIYEIAKDGKYIWCATTTGIVRWNVEDSTFVKFTPSEGIPGVGVDYLTVDKQGGIWCTASKNNNLGGVIGLGPYYFKDDNIIKRFIIEPVRMIFVDNENKKWVSIYSKEQGGNTWATFLGLYAIGVAGTFTAEHNGLPSNDVWSMAQESNGTYWFATGAGVARYDGTTWKVFGEGDAGLKSKYPDLLMYRNGLLYAVSGGYIQYYSGDAWI